LERALMGDIKLVYIEPTEEQKKHPKYKLAQEICKNTHIINLKDLERKIESKN